MSAIDYKVPARTQIGHVHLKVSDLKRSLDFYVGLLGFELTTTYGKDAAFISAGGYHHHIGLNTWESRGGGGGAGGGDRRGHPAAGLLPPPAGTTGLYHLAVLYPTRADLADALRRLMAAGIPLTGASDHGVSEALYLRDRRPGTGDIAELLAGSQDVWLASCGSFYASPFGTAGSP